MTLKEQILADNAVFLNSDDFGEDIVHWIGGDDRFTETIAGAVVEWDAEDRISNNHEGDSDRLSMEHGRKVRRTVDIEMPATVVISLGSPDASSRFVIGDAIEGTLVTAVRIVGRDHATQTVRCAVVERHYTKRTMVRR